MRKFVTIVALLSIIFITHDLYAEKTDPPALTRGQVTKLLTLLETETIPDIYAAIHFQAWKDPKEGLKSVTAEAIAEVAHECLSTKDMKLEAVSDPIVSGSSAAIILKRSGGEYEQGLFIVYLHYHSKAEYWGFLGLPTPYVTPSYDDLPEGIDRDEFREAVAEDDKFMEDALNDPTPYDGVLYEFDRATIKVFAQLTNKAEEQKKEIESKDKEDS